MIKGYKRYCDRCGVELTKRNNVCGFELCDKCNEVLGQQLAIKNDLADEQHKGDIMEFPKTFDEFANLYGFKDKDEVYTNGSELIPVFRVKQWLEHISTTKNDLGVDCISRDEVCRYVAEFVNHEFSTREEEELIDNIITGIEHMPSVTPQEPRKGHWIESMPGGAEEWCYKCSECNFWKYKKTINLSKFNYCPNCGADMREVEE